MLCLGCNNSSLALICRYCGGNEYQADVNRMRRTEEERVARIQAANAQRTYDDNTYEQGRSRPWIDGGSY